MAVRCGINTDIRRHFPQEHQSHSSSAQPVCKDALQECTDAQGGCTDAAGERRSGGRRRGKTEKALGEEETDKKKRTAQGDAPNLAV